MRYLSSKLIQICYPKLFISTSQFLVKSLDITWITFLFYKNEIKSNYTFIQHNFSFCKPSKWPKFLANKRHQKALKLFRCPLDNFKKLCNNLSDKNFCCVNFWANTKYEAKIVRFFFWWRLFLLLIMRKTCPSTREGKCEKLLNNEDYTRSR